jgi:hypothetical protein
MVLIGEPELPADTPVVFDVTLRDGSRPIKAEARVSGPLEPKDGRPGGLRVRFRRYGAPTKAFIERAVALATAGPDAPPVTSHAAEPSGSDVSSPEASAPVQLPPEASAPAPLAPEAPDTSDLASARVATASFTPVAATPSGHPDAPAALSALRTRGDRMPETPPNREYLLEKLRQRNTTEDVTMRYQRDA